MITFETFWRRLETWSVRQFGDTKSRGPAGALRHLLRELVEVNESNAADRVLEWADVFILAVDAMRRAGGVPRDAMSNKPGAGDGVARIERAARLCLDRAEGGSWFSHVAYAELLSAVFRAAEDDGVSGQDLIAAAWVKTIINERRVWGAPDADGIVSHVRGGR